MATKATISKKNERLLHTKSGNRCAICKTLLVDPDKPSLGCIGENAHIYGEKPDAARYDASKDDTYVNSEPILGHGNSNRIEDIKGRKNHAQISRNEAEISICSVIHDYYRTTHKNIKNYMRKLTYLWKYPFDEIIVAGHSVAGVDLPYFRQIDDITQRKSKWKIYYFRESEKEGMHKSLIEQGFVPKRFELLDSKEFYDLRR